MKHFPFALTLALFLVSCDSAEPNMAREDAVTFSIQSDALDGEVLAAKPMPQCWNDLDELISLSGSSLPDSSWVDRSDVKGNSYVLVMSSSNVLLYGVTTSPEAFLVIGDFGCYYNGIWVGWMAPGGGTRKYALTKAIVEASIVHYGLEP